jgi:hypothetical protein
MVLWCHNKRFYKDEKMGLPLVTLAEYKAYAGIASANQDAEIASIIPAASELIKSICQRGFNDWVDTAKVETFNGGYPKLFLDEYPILSISSVETSTDYGSTYTELVEFTDYVVDNEDNSIIRIGRDRRGLPLEFPRYTNGYRVTYYAGFETLPTDLRIAALDLVSYYLKHEGSIHSPKAPGSNTIQIEYVTKTQLPAHISRILDLYCGNYN